VAARETLEVQTRLLELQQAIVPVEAAVRLMDSIEHAHGFCSSRTVGSFSHKDAVDELSGSGDFKRRAGSYATAELRRDGDRH
jgi:hypothetical protein